MINEAPIETSNFQLIDLNSYLGELFSPQDILKFDFWIFIQDPVRSCTYEFWKKSRLNTKYWLL